MKQICYSLLPACVDPDGAGGKPFRAEAIIANPPAYGMCCPIELRVCLLLVAGFVLCPTGLTLMQT